MKKLAIAFLFLLLISPSAKASGWIVETKVDSMTDEVKKSARTCNDMGYCLSIYLLEDKQVWGNFSLPDTNTDVLSHEKLPMYRIDKHKADDLEHLKTLEELLDESFFKVEPKWINFKISIPVEIKSDIRGNLKDLIEGNKIVFRYYLSTGGSKETTISLTGAQKAIYEVLDVSNQ